MTRLALRARRRRRRGRVNAEVVALAGLQFNDYSEGQRHCGNGIEPTTYSLGS
jgi:hypothetical protein